MMGWSLNTDSERERERESEKERERERESQKERERESFDAVRCQQALLPWKKPSSPPNDL